MYSLNGVALDNDTFKWSLQDSTEPYLGVSRRVADLSVAGRDGNVPVPSSADSPVMSLVIRTDDIHLDALLALLESPTLTISRPLRWADVEFLSASPRIVGGMLGIIDVTVLLRFYGMFWRDFAATTETFTIPDADETFTVMSGLSAPVRDAIIRVGGSVTGLKVTAANGSFFSYAPNVPAGSFLRFEAATGRAFVTTSDTWTGGTEVTGSIVNGPGPYFLDAIPVFTDPTTRATTFRVTTSARAGTPQFAVRGKRAYRV